MALVGVRVARDGSQGSTCVTRNRTKPIGMERIPVRMEPGGTRGSNGTAEKMVEFLFPKAHSRLSVERTSGVF